MKELKQQTKANPIWVDEKGMEVQFKRTSECERLKEKEAFRIAKEAMGLNKELTEFKERLKGSVDKVVKVFMKENGIDIIGKGKGNFTFFNFVSLVNFAFM